MTHNAKIKAIFFDFHNTLATCDPWLQLEIRDLPGLALKVLAKEGLVPPPNETEKARAEKLFRRVRQEVRESGVELSAVEGTERVFRAMGYDAAVPYLERVVVELEEGCFPSVEPVPGASDAVWALHREGYRLGVISSAGYPPFVEGALEMLGLRAAFSVVLTSAGEGIYKSDPRIFRRAADELGAQPEEAVHIGDHAIFDVQTAQAAGMSAIWFRGEAKRTAHLHSTSWDEMVRAGERAEAVVERMAEVCSAVQGL